jgi:protocatechuate 3,4-dioxygenase beta subunit
VIYVEKRSYRAIQGTIVYGGGSSPVENALVEVWTKPDYLFVKLPEDSQAAPQQRRVGRCKTSEDGRFCFRGLPTGRYELRASIAPGWNVTHVYVVVDPKGTTKELQVTMHPGT